MTPINNLDRFIKKETDSLVLEKIHTKFCNFILGVRTKFSNMGANLKIDLNFLYVLNLFLEFGLTLLSSFRLSVQFCLNLSFKQYLTLHKI
jgi:hypothetical protein